MTNGNTAEPEMLSATEGLDEDELAVDPLEGGVEPPENWSAAERFGATSEEVREGESLEQKLTEEQPDIDPGQVPERPIAITPVDELDDSIDDVVPDVEPVSPEERARQ